ncbi:MAG: hypothetical protein AAB263_18635, partial [Planctomycetota bacterium]
MTCMQHARSVLLTLVVLLIWLPSVGQAEERLAYVFQDNMVLQREKPVPIWGWGSAGTQVDVSFAGQKKETKADERGAWKVTLDPLVANRVGQELVVHIGTAAITRKNILVGEVWMAAGQSNMRVGGPDLDTGVYPHYRSPGTTGGKPEIRICDFGWGASMEPLTDIDPAGRTGNPWTVLKEDPPAAILGMSQYFSRVVRDGLDLPVGIMLVAVSGTNQTAWMAKETLESFPGKSGNFFQEFLATHADRVAKGGGTLTTWDAFKQAETAWRETKKGPWPGNGQSFINYPTVLYNTRIHPLAPFAIRGAIWNQGEGGPFGPYGDRMAAMVKQWRGLFGQDFHLLVSTLGRHCVDTPPLTPARSGFYRAIVNGSLRDSPSLYTPEAHATLVELFDLGDD